MGITAINGFRYASCPAAILAAGMLFAPVAQAGEKLATGVIRDLEYGEVLFSFYQDDYFSALSKLLVARDAGRVSHHETEAELLLGGLYLSYGQHERAQEIFDRLLTDPVDSAIQDRAWFYLGKVQYQRGRFADADAAFRKVGNDLPQYLDAERRLLMSQGLMARGMFAPAAAILESWQGPDELLAYGRYNLGVALVRMNRLEEGARLLDKVGRMSGDTEEIRALRDKANLALGYAYLQEELEGQAKPVLQRVSLHGPFSNKALLGVGWVDAIQQNYRQALVPWMELKSRDLLDSAVQESLLAIPYAMGRLEAHGSAAQNYLTALDVFDTEIGRLDTAIESARSGTMIPALLEADNPQIARWYWQLERVPDTAQARYLYHLIANHELQDGLRNYRDLMALQQHLDRWAEKLEAFDDMVATRWLAYRQRALPTSTQIDAVDLDRYLARRDRLAGELEAIERSRDIAGLANARERTLWQQLQALEDHPAWQADGLDDARQTWRVLKGFLSWKLDREYKYRMWQQKRSLDGLNEALAQAVRRRDSVDVRLDSVPRELEAFSDRIAAVLPRIERMRAEVAAALMRQQNGIQVLAVRELEAQKERLATYRIQARFALATIYDRATASTD